MENTELIQIKDNKIKRFFKKVYTQWLGIWDSKIQTFILLSILMTIILAILIIYPLCYGTFFNCYTDDIIQYYPYVTGFFEKIKNGTLSLYDTTLLGGTSFFSGVYYIPLDIFLGFAFLLSFIIPAEIAYCISNIFRIIAGTMLIYYIFIRKGLKTKTSFIVSVIYFIGGVSQTYFIFPVFLGIAFYAPLAMLIIDLCIEKKGMYYLTIPIYTLVVILYDFYIAYMLLAFVCVYFVIQMHMTSKKFFLASGNFWLKLIELLLLIFIGLMMASFFLVPSVFYVINDSTRSSQSSNDFLWLYGTDNNGKIEISIRHYFTQWCNLFSPNKPHNLGLVEAGDYIREHASLYITSGGLIYLVYFFFIWGTKENKLKFWIIIMNLLFCIPLAAMIFTFNGWPYVRWFFIPYMINMYGMALGMDKYNYKIGNYKSIKILPVIILCLALASMIYVLVKDPKIFIHYSKTSDDFYPIVIGTIVCLSIYLVLLILEYIMQAFNKNPKIIYKLVPITIFAECVFACAIMISTTGGLTYFDEKDEMYTQKNHLYDLGYKEKDGYRINLYSDNGKNVTNANILVGNVNHTNFFQSFYPDTLYDYSNIIHNDYRSGWNKKSIHGYTAISGPMFNLKYVVTGWDCNHVKLPEELYTNYGEYSGSMYYELKDLPQFIVYDTVYTVDSNDSSSIFVKDLSLLEYGFVIDPDISQDELNIIEDEDKLEQYDIMTEIIESGVNVISSNEAFTNINQNNDIYVVGNASPDYYDLNDMYYTYDLTSPRYTKLLEYDAIYVAPAYNVTNSNSGSYEVIGEGGSEEHMYFRKDENTYYPFHYNIGYLSCYEKSEIKDLMIRSSKDNTNQTIYFYGFNYDIYNNFIARQSQYSNRYFLLDNDTMRIKFTNTDTSTKIIKTAYTYSDDWYVNNNSYQTCNINGGFLGIIVPENTTNVDITLTFEPYGYSTGCKISAVGCIIYLGITIPVLTIIIYKGKKLKKEKLEV